MTRPFMNTKIDTLKNIRVAEEMYEANFDTDKTVIPDRSVHKQ